MTVPPLNGANDDCEWPTCDCSPLSACPGMESLCADMAKMIDGAGTRYGDSPRVKFPPAPPAASSPIVPHSKRTKDE
jgi:hypothetical protein